MLTYEDCLGLCGLEEDEVDALGEFEHVPDIVALELANHLIETPEGERYLARAIVAELDAARGNHDTERLQRLETALKHFLATHPAARSRAR